ncbi:MAG: phosphoenolpyruvate--protein phosphotransferase [Kiritimatiellales bacterium]
MSNITDSSGEIILQGIGVSPGVAIGEVVVFRQDGSDIPDYPVPESSIPAEISRFEEALAKTRRQLTEIRGRAAGALGEKHAGIFDAHLLVVDDRYIYDAVLAGLKKEHRNVEAVLNDVAGKYIDALSKVKDDYLRERAGDVRDVIHRIVKNLIGEGGMDRMNQLERPCIALAYDFTPSDTAGVDKRIVQAMVADAGSSTSHTAIMARALEVPAVVGLHDASTKVSSGDTVLVDGGKGLLIIRPTSERLLAYAQKMEAQKNILVGLEELKDKPSETQDGYRVPIAANIELPLEIAGIHRYGANGIGLFRTEFLFLNTEEPPDEEAQYKVYKNAADLCAPDNVVIRTLDLGGDKIASDVKMTAEANPFLGWRAIRYCLSHTEFFKTQLRAILRAAAGRKISIMYPMISCLSEVLAANRLLEECKQELKAEGKSFAAEIDVGIMIEIPSAALTADIIAPHIDFFSIGTNDLIQYTLAVDRVNDHVAHLYKPAHTAIIKLIQQTVAAGHKHRIPVAVCGEMAATPELVPLLIGLGVDELSVSPPAVPMIKDVVRNLHYAECRALAKDILQLVTSDEILQKCRELIQKTSPEILELFN